MKREYISPEKSLKAFNCPNCHVYAKQSWFFMAGASDSNGFRQQYQNESFLISSCQNCSSPTIWLGDKIIFPIHSASEPPNSDLPDEIKHDYEEARTIANLSPRGAAALLRLSIQKLCAHLGQSGTNINNDIKALVESGLPPKVQQALDSVRVIGNEAVHPGEIDLKDDLVTVNKLFKLVNFIANKMITEPREIDEIYNTLPENKIEGINQRDRNN
ncbi:hypothetical protein BOW53_02980 [Solemya pervernicosa gill symbiont]|uniref:DUF4145 domain-containing protein n=1 Tax=Solemya pervernicosa gill symbiont TaxID=642797 RepID=A0A1T2L960_9GAMM|nr:DUF4145 domain-containing protein [Solemya pervernicosa gill symbiont]OOZ41658.1 hypothetical protein BOW53_02980 [Solemya pervernicosa gill symbiont]